MTYFEELQQVLSRLDPSPLLDFVRECQGTLWLAGNGGSASTAQHWACDLSKAAGRRVQALGCNPAVLTAWANDERYEDALAMELERLYRFDGDDAVIALSCSGTSPNIQRLLTRASEHGLATALVTGRGYTHDGPTTIIRIPHHGYGIIEDATSAIGHWLTEELRKR